jgi:hypothetical protein
MPPFRITKALLPRPAMSTVSRTSPLAVLTPPLMPGATRKPERSTVKGLPAFAGRGLAVMP